MKRLLISLFLVFSLAAGPAVHAAWDVDPGCSMADQFSKEKKQDDGKVAKVAHSCCQHPAAQAIHASVSAIHVKHISPFVPADTGLASITVGPLLEPPSRA